jgi:hypothetical protein
MAKMIVGVYSKNISFTENKTNDLYITIDNENLFFSVKNSTNGQFIAFEHFKSVADEKGWESLILITQHNSKLINLHFGNVFFVWNNSRFILTKKVAKQTQVYYQQELNLVHGANNTDEVYFNAINDDLILAYSVPDQLINLLSKIFPNGVWHHYTEYVINKKIDNNALICLLDNQFCLKITKNGATQLINYFPLEGANQNIYQIINACNHISLDTNNASINVLGYDEDGHGFVKTIANYFKVGQVAESDEHWDNEDKGNCPNNIYTTYLIY